MGHAGTLDPFATGVLVCLMNRATRLAQFLLRGKKQYQAVLHLGVATDTQDPTGRVVDSRPVPDFSEEDLQQVFRQYVGTVEQIPPAYSALKHNGVALYKLARRGHAIQKPARSVHIERLEIVAVALCPRSISPLPVRLAPMSVRYARISARYLVAGDISGHCVEP